MTKLETLCVNAGQEFRRFSADEKAATAVEYAIVAVGIGAVLVAAIGGIGSSVKGAFTSASNGLN